MLVFSSLELPNDNTRKCFVEIRPDISGDFKGLIYCQNLEDAREVERIVQPIIIEKISSEISIQVKRGCSEFPASFPEFSAFDDNGMPTMAYNKEWREQEDYADKNLVDHKYPPAFNSHNHSGLTLRDVLVMHTWLAYAKMIGDASYLKISRTPVEKLRMDDRSAFHSDQMA